RSASPARSAGVGAPPGLVIRVEATSGRAGETARITPRPVFYLERLGFGGLDTRPGPRGRRRPPDGGAGGARPGRRGGGAGGGGGGGRRGGRRAGRLGGGGWRRRRAREREHQRQRGGAAGRLHFLIRPMIGASGFGSMVTTTRASFFRYCCATRWTAAASTAR